MSQLKKVFAKGLNIAAQINPTRNSYRQFVEVEQLRGKSIRALGCGYLQSYYLLGRWWLTQTDDGQFLKAGYFMDTLTSIRISNLHRLAPFLIPLLQKLKFMGRLLSFRGGSQCLQFLNKPELDEQVRFVDATIAQSRAYLHSDCNEVYAIGENYFGQLITRNCVSNDKCFRKVEAIDSRKIKAIGCGFQHTLVVTENGNVYGCGRAQYYQIQPEKQWLGNNLLFDKIEIPELIFRNIKAKKVVGGFRFSLILTDDDKLYSLGSNRFGQCGFNHLKIQQVNKPTLVPFLSAEQAKSERILDIACGYCHVLILTTQNVYFMGSLEQNQNPFSTFSENICSPSLIDLPAKPVKIFANFDRSAIITCDGRAYIFGGRDNSRCGGESGNLQVVQDWPLNANSLIGLGFAHTVIAP